MFVNLSFPNSINLVGFFNLATVSSEYAEQKTNGQTSAVHS